MECEKQLFVRKRVSPIATNHLIMINTYFIGFSRVLSSILSENETNFFHTQLDLSFQLIFSIELKPKSFI